MIWVDQRKYPTEFDAMWAKLAAHPVNAGQKDRFTAEHPESGEIWQYMGTANYGPGRLFHEFRHRHHPKTNQREYWEIPASENFCRDFQ